MGRWRTEIPVMVNAATDVADLGEVLPAEEVADETEALVDTSVEDTGADGEGEGATTDPGEPAWIQTEEGRAYIRSYRRNLQANITDTMLKAIRGELENKDNLSSHDRRSIREVNAEIDRRAASRAQEATRPESPEQEFARLYPLLKDMDHWTFGEWAKANSKNRKDAGWFLEFQDWQEQSGIPLDAPLEVVQAVIERQKALAAQQTAATQSAASPTDLDAVYEQFQREDGWALLTEDEQDRLDPDNFNQANPVRARRAMEGLFQTLIEAAEARAPKEPTTADKARALARRMPPGVTGGRTPGRVTFDQARDALLEARASGVGIAAAQETYERARKAAGLT